MTEDASPSAFTESVQEIHSEISRVLREVEEFLDGKALDPSATVVAEQVLCDQALRHELVFEGRKLATLLRGKGLSVELNYCTSKSHGHPLPFLIVRQSDGSMVIPEQSDITPKLKHSRVCVIDCNEKTELRCRIVQKGEHLEVDPVPKRHAPTKTGALILVPFYSD